MTVVELSGTRPSAPQAAPAAPPTAEPPRVEAPPPVGRFVGRERVFWRILVRGAVLLALTLGLYRFWLATETRRYLWTNTEIAGDGLEYTGTPLELLLGFLTALVLLIPVYLAFFVAALDLGLLGKLAGVLAFVFLAFIGQVGVFRARRYRLTRTVFRGLRFHQTGSSLRYAMMALLWWVLNILSIGLTYPWSQASLERYKLSNTFYGDLRGSFTGSGLRLFWRGLLMWLMVMGPFGFGLFLSVVAIDWDALVAALEQSGGDVLARLEGTNPGLVAGLTFALLALSWAAVAAALLYPVFQAMVLRWWLSGLRFGEVSVMSRLSTGRIYGAYLRFVIYAVLFAIAFALIASAWIGVVGTFFTGNEKSTTFEIVTTVGLVGGYVLVALGYSTIYQATVKLRLWRFGVASLEFAGIEALDRVTAVSQRSTAVGEGLADALNVGGV